MHALENRGNRPGLAERELMIIFNEADSLMLASFRKDTALVASLHYTLDAADSDDDASSIETIERMAMIE
jgi:hypothetical protein